MTMTTIVTLQPPDRDPSMDDMKDSVSTPAASRATAGDASLATLRTEIERVDATIIAALAERMQLSRAVGRQKAATGQPVTDPAREAAVVARASARARDAGLPEDEIRALYWRIMAVSRKAQHDTQHDTQHETQHDGRREG